MAYAVNGDTLNLSPYCTYILTNSYDSGEGLPLIKATVTINGNSATISRTSSAVGFRLLHVTSSGNLTVNGLTLNNGHEEAGSLGGGIYNEGTLTITNVLLSNNNSDGFGGGIDNAGTLTVNNSGFSKNHGFVEGGGIYNTGTLTVTNSSFTSNSSGFGGGIQNKGSHRTRAISGSTFSGNSGNGGGLNNDQGTISIRSSSFVANTSDGDGGGIENNGPMTIVNSTFANNSAAARGGGFSVDSFTTTITNSTFVGNSAGASGGGVSPPSGGFGYGILILNNSIVENNTNGDCVNQGTLTTSHNLIKNRFTACGLTNGVNGNIIGLDAMLALVGGSPAYYPLLARSPAIDKGDNSLIPAGVTTDETGQARIRNGTVDLGAVEYSRDAKGNSATQPSTLTGLDVQVDSATNGAITANGGENNVQGNGQTGNAYFHVIAEDGNL